MRLLLLKLKCIPTGIQLRPAILDFQKGLLLRSSVIYNKRNNAIIIQQ